MRRRPFSVDRALRTSYGILAVDAQRRRMATCIAPRGRMRTRRTIERQFLVRKFVPCGISPWTWAGRASIRKAGKGSYDTAIRIDFGPDAWLGGLLGALRRGRRSELGSERAGARLAVLAGSAGDGAGAASWPAGFRREARFRRDDHELSLEPDSDLWRQCRLHGRLFPARDPICADPGGEPELPGPLHRRRQRPGPVHRSPGQWLHGPAPLENARPGPGVWRDWSHRGVAGMEGDSHA